MLSTVYLIELRDKVTGATKKIKKSLTDIVPTMTTTGKKASMLERVFGRVAGRALMTIPAWFALRRVFLGIISVFGQMTGGMLDLDSGMSRIRTVMHGDANIISSDMKIIEESIVNMSVKTGKSLKELAETFYFLKTANLESEEAMAAFAPTVAAMTGTGVGGKTMARAVAGIYNTMGSAMGDTMSTAEKMTHIADVLTYTYSTQDVQMDELINSYTKLKPFVTGLGDSFLEITTFLGVMNTHMLRAGRTGRLTGRTILQIIKNQDKLAKLFGVTLDPNQPIKFLDVLDKINEKLKASGDQLKPGALSALQEVFGTRGQNVPRILTEAMQDYKKAVKEAAENSRDFAEMMQDIQLGTVRAQAARVNRAIGALGRDFVTGAMNGGEFALALKKIADNLESMREKAETTGLFIQWLGLQIVQVGDILNTLFDDPNAGLKLAAGPIGAAIAIKQAFDKVKASGGFKSPYEWMEYVWQEQIANQEKSGKYEKDLNKYRKQGADNAERSNEAQRFRVNQEKQETEEVRHQVEIMKIMGKTELEIARYKLETFKMSQLTRTEDERRLELMKLQNREKEAEFRLQQDIKNAQLGIVSQYETASPLDKPRLRRLSLLREKSPEELAGEYNMGGRDRGLLIQYMNTLSPDQQNAIRQAQADRYGFQTATPTMPTAKELQAKAAADTGQYVFEINQEVSTIRKAMEIQSKKNNEQMNQLIEALRKNGEIISKKLETEI